MALPLRVSNTSVTVLYYCPGGRIVLWDFEVSVEIGNRSFKLYHPRLRCWVHRGDEERSGGVLLHERDNLSMMPLDTLPRKGRAQLLDTAAPAVSEYTGPRSSQGSATGGLY